MPLGDVCEGVDADEQKEPSAFLNDCLSRLIVSMV